MGGSGQAELPLLNELLMGNVKSQEVMRTLSIQLWIKVGKEPLKEKNHHANLQLQILCFPVLKKLLAIILEVLQRLSSKTEPWDRFFH